MATAKKAAAKPKTKSKVNEAGNYTKPGMRKSLLIKLRPVLKAEIQANGQLEKLSY